MLVFDSVCSKLLHKSPQLFLKKGQSLYDVLDLLRNCYFIPYANNSKYHTAQSGDQLFGVPPLLQVHYIPHIFVLSDAFPFFALKISFAKVNHPVLGGNSVKADVCIKAMKMYFCICINTQLCLREPYFLICSSFYLPSAFVPLRDQKNGMVVFFSMQKRRNSTCVCFVSVSCICVRRFAHLITKKPAATS